MLVVRNDIFWHEQRHRVAISRCSEGHVSGPDAVGAGTLMRNLAFAKKCLGSLRYQRDFRRLKYNLLRRNEYDTFGRSDFNIVVMSLNLNLPACRNKLHAEPVRKQADTLQRMQHQLAPA